MLVKIVPLHIVRDDKNNAPNSPPACVVKKLEARLENLMQEPSPPCAQDETMQKDVLGENDIEMQVDMPKDSLQLV